MSLNKTGSDLVLDLINDINYTDIEYGSVEFVTPTVLSSDPSFCNTEVDVVSVPKHGYTGEVSVKYNRIDIIELLEVADPAIEIPDDGDITDVIAEINNLYALRLVVGVDVSADIDLSSVSIVPSSLSIPVLSSSLVFTGTIDIVISYNYVIESYLAGNYYTMMASNLSTSDKVINDVLGFYDSELDNFYIFGKTSQYNLRNNYYRFKLGIFSTVSGAINSHTARTLAVVENKAYMAFSNKWYRFDVVSGGAAGIWTGVGAAGPLGSLYYTTVAAVGDTLFLLSATTTPGTQNKANQIATGYSYDMVTDTWTAIAALPSPYGMFSANNGHAVCSDGARYIYVLGGRIYAKSSDTLNTSSGILFQYDTVNNTWATLTSSITYLRVAYCNLVYVNGSLYCFGGVGSNGNIYRFDMDTLAWVDTGDYITNSKAVAIVRKDNVFIYGGDSTYNSTLGRIV